MLVRNSKEVFKIMADIRTKDRVLYEVFKQFTATYNDAIIESYDTMFGGKIDTSKLSTADILDLAYNVADEIEFENRKEKEENES